VALRSTVLACAAYNGRLPLQEGLTGVRIIGLTGGIASGKSTAAKMLEARGARRIDADVLGHRAYDPGTGAFNAVVHEFGAHIVAADGSIDRRALGGEVFGKPERLTALTNIVWPEIRRLAELEIDAIRAADGDAVVILEAAVLFEAGWEDAVDEVWVAVVAPEIAIARATARDGVDAEAVKKRLDAQLSNDERTARADHVIDNAGDQDALEREVQTAWSRVRAG
jgi:dephospho-CoA kinase